MSREIRDLLELETFKAVGVGAGAVSLVRKINKTREELIFSYNKFPGAYKLSPYVSGWKTFDSVNDILKKHFKDNGIGYQDYTIHITSRRIEEIALTSVSELSDLQRIKESLKILVEEDVLPFFFNYQTLEDVHSHLMELEVEDIANFITNPPQPRIMIIKRLVNAADWESYCSESIEMYKEQSEGRYKAVFEPIYRLLPDLYEELKNMEV
ncbi:hypothetical protein [Croceiramulus getboli]|nr:hypothetical protein P8624_06585 [Flavobacteriaceae bacterium YJPT1-3]